MRIAIISDIHGNLPALNSVFNDIKNRNIDKMICLGDLVDFAPWSNEVIDLIRLKDIPTIMGNHDERIALDMEIIPLSKHTLEESQARIVAINHTKSTISLDNKTFLRHLPHEVKLDCKGVKLHFTHASPISNDEYLYEDNEDLLEERSKGLDADFLFIGHTHIPYIKNLNNKTIVNVGSVGRSKLPDNKACYAILDISDRKSFAEIIKVDYPVEETIEAIELSGIPNFYADFLMERK